MHDTYEFNQDQPLGLLRYAGVSMSPGPGRFLVENGDFRKWRTRFGRGGDFMVFSDVHWVGVAKPLLWHYSMKQRMG